MDNEQISTRISDQDLILKDIKEKMIILSGNYEDLREKVAQKQQLDADMVVFSNQMKQNSEFVKKSILDFQKRIDLLDREFMVCRNHLDGHSEKMHKLDIRMSNIEDLINESQYRHQRNENRTYDLEQSKLELMEFKKNQIIYNNENFKNIGDLSFLNKKQDLKIQEHEDNLKKQLYQVNEIDKWGSEHWSNIIYLVKGLQEIKKEMDSFVRTHQESLSETDKRIDEKISKIPKVEIPPQIDVKSAVSQEFNALSSKLNDIKLDLENAALRYNNNEVQTKVFEKKLENLSLQLKKYEITK